MTDKTKGIHNKFNVTRNDGTDAPGQKHDGCEYFVLDLTHDPYALDALEAYAKACRYTHPELAKDLKAALPQQLQEGSRVRIVDAHGTILHQGTVTDPGGPDVDPYFWCYTEIETDDGKKYSFLTKGWDYRNLQGPQGYDVVFHQPNGTFLEWDGMKPGWRK